MLNFPHSIPPAPAFLCVWYRIGEEEVEFNPSFKLILHTKLSNPHYPPEVQAETALINFAVTEVGVVELLLSLVVRKEMYDLACKRDELLVQQNQFRVEVKRLEDQILAKLAAAEGDVTQVRSMRRHALLGGSFEAAPRGHCPHILGE